MRNRWLCSSFTRGCPYEGVLKSLSFLALDVIRFPYGGVGPIVIWTRRTAVAPVVFATSDLLVCCRATYEVECGADSPELVACCEPLFCYVSGSWSLRSI